MTRTPKLTANLGLAFTHHYGPGELGFTPSIYYSSSYNIEITGRIPQASYTNLNAEVFWAQDQWRLSLWGKNLTDYRRVSLVQQIGATGDLVNYLPPLEMGVSASYSF